MDNTEHSPRICVHIMGLYTIERGDPRTYHFVVPDQSSYRFHPFHPISWYWLLTKRVTSLTHLTPHQDLCFVIQGPLSGPQIHCRELQAQRTPAIQLSSGEFEFENLNIADWANIHTFVATVYSYFKEQISMFTDEFFRESMVLFFQLILRSRRIRRICKSMS